MDEKFKATKELIQFVIAFIKAIDESISDGISISDSINFIKPALLSIDVIKDMNTVSLELKNLDESQIQELCDLVTVNLSQTDKKEQVIKKSLELGVRIFDLYSFIKK